MNIIRSEVHSLSLLFTHGVRASLEFDKRYIEMRATTRRMRAEEQRTLAQFTLASKEYNRLTKRLPKEAKQLKR
jgi:hypothetical protein